MPQLNLQRQKHEIFVPQQWATVIRMARRKDPYMIVPLKFGDIYDFKEFTKKYMKFRKENVNGKKVNWFQIKWIRYTQENPDCIMCKYNFEDEFIILKVAGTAKRGCTAEPQELTRKYTSRQKISAAYAEVVSSHLNTTIITNHCPQAVM